MKRLPLFILPLAAAGVLAACGGADQSQGPVVEAETVVIDSTAEQTMVVGDLPSHTLKFGPVPASITDPGERIDYLTKHYWDSLNFRDEAMTSDLLLIEQTFSDFIALLPDCTDEGARELSIRECLKLAAIDPPTFQYIARLAEDYLYDRDSPFRDEQLYRLFINNMLASHLPTEGEKTRLRRRRDMINRAAPGTPVPEVNIRFNDGSATRLSQIIEGTNTLLIFYDSKNPDDRQAISALSSDERINKCLEGNTVRIIALNTGDSLALPSPAYWVSASAPDATSSYVMRVSPSGYLIGRDQIILLKDMDTAEIQGLF